MLNVASEPKYKYEVRQIEAWASDEEEGWTENQSWHMGHFYTRSDNVGRALTRFLHRKGIIFKPNRTLIEGDSGGVYEIIDRKTKEPMFAAIYTEEVAK